MEPNRRSKAEQRAKTPAWQNPWLWGLLTAMVMGIAVVPFFKSDRGRCEDCFRLLRGRTPDGWSTGGSTGINRYYNLDMSVEETARALSADAAKCKMIVSGNVAERTFVLDANRSSIMVCDGYARLSDGVYVPLVDAIPNKACVEVSESDVDFLPASLLAKLGLPDPFVARLKGCFGH